MCSAGTPEIDCILDFYLILHITLIGNNSVNQLVSV